jgi:hypothetical protein
VSRILGRGADHERARTLLAQRMDEPILPMDAEWLDSHLATCDACGAVADDYEADRSVLRSLRAATPEPPRDLWARTAAAIEAEAGKGRGAAGAPRPERRVLGIPAAVHAPVSGLAVVAIVVGAALFNSSPVVPGAAATPIPLRADVAVLNRGTDGSLQISTGRLNEVCPVTGSGCSVEPSFDTYGLALGTSADVEGVISPKGDHLVVIQRDPTGSGGVFVVPVHSRPTASPSPASGSSAMPAVTATVAPTPAPTTTPTETPSASPVASATSTPTASTAVPTPEPSGAGTSASGSPSEPPTEPPSDAATPAPSVSPEASDTPTETPVVEVTPRPDGALEIATNVVVVAGPAAYSADGGHFAFTARPADGSGGPDVYVWDTKETVARAITNDHRSVFADWAGDDLLVSRVDDGSPSTVQVDTNGKAVDVASRSAWLPALSPDGSRAAWWDGSVALADDGVTWVPDTGHLVVGAWPDTGDGTQALSDGKLDDWQVRWDPNGTALAAWLAPKGSRDAGRLSLYRIDPSTGRLDLAKPMLDGEQALGAFTLNPGVLAWSAPGKSAGRTLQVLAWQGDHMDRGEVPAEGGATLVQ